MVAHFEHVIVTFNQARQHRTVAQIDFFGPYRDLNAPGGPHFGNAIALYDDHLVAREAVGLAIEQLPGVNHQHLLTLSSQPGAGKPEGEQCKSNCRLRLHAIASQKKYMPELSRSGDFDLARVY